MAERTTTVGSKAGLHARPASVLVEAAASSGHQVHISKADAAPVDATSILSLMTLGAEHGETVILVVEGEDAETVADQLVEIISTEQDH